MSLELYPKPDLSKFLDSAIPISLACQYWFCPYSVYLRFKHGDRAGERAIEGAKQHELEAIRNISKYWFIEGSPIQSIDQAIIRSRSNLRIACQYGSTLANSENEITFCAIDKQTGLVGFPDMAECSKDRILIIEKKYPAKLPREPRIGHLVQLGMYLKCIKQLFPNVVGRLDYTTGDRTRSFLVRLDPELQQLIQATIEGIRGIQGGLVPKPAPAKSKCPKCGYYDVCDAYQDFSGG